MKDQVRPWRLLRESGGSAGFIRVTNRTYVLPNGNESTWDIVHGGRTVAVLACTSDHRIVTARQFRPGPDQVLYELPGGGVDPEEAVLDAAARELREETGYDATRMELVGRTWLSSRDTVQRFAVLALDCEKTHQLQLDDEELIEPTLLTMSEFMTILRSGNLTDTDLAWMCLDRLKPFEFGQP